MAGRASPIGGALSDAFGFRGRRVSANRDCRAPWVRGFGYRSPSAAAAALPPLPACRRCAACRRCPTASCAHHRLLTLYDPHQNLMAWMVAGGLAYYLWVVPAKQRDDEQQRVREQVRG